MVDSKVRLTKGGRIVHPRVARGLRKLGKDISLARRVRKMSAEDFVQRVGISRATLHRLERGDPGIALNTLAMALHALGRLDALVNLADPMNDDVSMMQMRDQAPKRINRPRVRAALTESEGAPETVADSKFVGF